VRCDGNVLVSSTSAVISPVLFKVVRFRYWCIYDRINEFPLLRDVGKTYLPVVM
jgi:hypothetical protein